MHIVTGLLKIMYQKIQKNKYNYFIKKSKIRAILIEMLFSAQSGHAGSSLSMVDLLVYFYFQTLNIKIKFQIYNQDMLPAWYATLIELGILKKNIYNLKA